MRLDEYNSEYFRKTRDSAGLLLKTTRPLWWRWVKVIQKISKKGGNDAYPDNQS